MFAHALSEVTPFEWNGENAENAPFFHLVQLASVKMLNKEIPCSRASVSNRELKDVKRSQMTSKCDKNTWEKQGGFYQGQL